LLAYGDRLCEEDFIRHGEPEIDGPPIQSSTG
jgi:hypothetical protein